MPDRDRPPLVTTEIVKRPQANGSANPSGLASLLSTPSRVASS
ncbi:MAG: hypothetical protein ACLSTO_12880 [Bilophila wadsworthia]